NGNAGHDGNGHEGQIHFSGRTLYMHLPRSSNMEHDISCMQDINDMLRANAGHDRVMLYLANGVGTVVLQPHYTVHASSELLEELGHLLGSDRGVAGVAPAGIGIAIQSHSKPGYNRRRNTMASPSEPSTRRTT
ncbi:MAG: hypothetical protein HC828_16190, partial [Blastochloris sp.]|nr:hypothetical protein [Blastochloris sp.]